MKRNIRKCTALLLALLMILPLLGGCSDSKPIDNTENTGNTDGRSGRIQRLEQENCDRCYDL